MKRSGKRLLAVLLCLAMALTLLPVSALARWDDDAIPAIPADGDGKAAVKAELPMIAEGDDISAGLSAGTVPGDGVTNDVWSQDSQTVLGENGGGAICAKTADGVRLKTGTSNGNNHGATNSGWPAVFVNETANAALSATTGDKFVEVVFNRKAGTNPRFGLILNYTSPTDGLFVGFDNADGKWLLEEYHSNGDSDWNGLPSGGSAPAESVDTRVRMEWNDTKLISVSVDGTQIIGEYTFTDTHAGKGVGFRLAKWDGGDQLTEVTIKEMHYSGQASVNVYNVSGTVTDEGNKALAGVAVKAGSNTTTTDDQGNYALENLVAGTYTLTFQKTGYTVAPKSVTVSNADVTVPVVKMAETDTILIETDGVNNGDWEQVESTKQDSAVDPTVVNGELVLTAGYTNGHKLAANPRPAAFTSAKMTQALGTVAGERTISFTLTPECGKDANKSNVGDYMAFGVVLNASGDSTGYGISFANKGDDANYWLVQQFNNGVGAGYNTLATLLPEVGEPMKFEITWTDTTVTIKINDQELSHGVAMGNVARSNTVAFTVGGMDYNDDQLQNEHRPTRIRISNLHYSGQEVVEARYVSGTVKSGTKAVKDATVSVTGAGNEAYKTVTDAAGAYKLAVPIRDTAYTLQAAKDGFVTGSQSVAVTATANKDTLSAVNFTLTELPTISGKVVDKNNKGIRGATVQSNLRPKDAPAAVTDDNGNFTVIGAVDGEHTLTANAEGYQETTAEVTVDGANVTGVNIQMPDRIIPFHTLSTDDMDVTVAQAFPQVIQYTMKGDLEGKTMYGQTAELDTIKINDKEVKLAADKVTSEVDDEENPTKVTYEMVIDDSNNNSTGVTATITAEIRVGLDDVNNKTSAAAGRTLGFYITGVEYAGADDAAKKANRLAHPVDTIEIPNHSLVSVRGEDAMLTGAKLAGDSLNPGDTTYAAESKKDGDSENFFAAFVYNSELAAGLASNSAYGGGTAGSATYPVRAQVEDKEGGSTKSIGLGSVLWYYDHDITNNQPNGYLELTETQLPREKRVIAPLDMPYAKVVITDDMNKTDTVDWQDGAIAYRETVMHIPKGGESVANTANLRISMNFGSMATNPFLIALDNVKRVSAHTDGLGQFVLLKGYAGEGHDSNHPQYDNIGIRMGGPDDLKTLMTEGEKLGAIFGIHVNASEFYAEAIKEEAQVLRFAGSNMRYGWNWLDQGISINAVYDYASGLRKARWDALYAIVQGHPFVVYVDVWGNNTSGREDDFQTRALSNEITSYDGWRIAHEWSWANPYESTFQHWTTDYTYGNYSDKGKLNSNVLRFLLNQYKDSFPADFATYGGACNAPLLGGPAMQGFEGWQQDGEYNLSIYNTFNQMIYTKFLQHYSITEWTNATKAVKMAYNGNRGDRTSEADWTPEVQIKLAGGDDEIVVTRGTTGNIMTDATLAKMSTASGFLANETEYRSRVVTLNGKVIVTGAPASAGEDPAFPESKATLKYLIPWYWNVKGERVDEADEKLYHWNAQGGQSTWDLPDGWNVSTVLVYELSDQGRGAPKTVKVIGGKVTLSGIKANTGYVVTKGAEANNAPVFKYGTGLHLGDPSFNLDTTREDNPWTVSDDAGSAIHTTNSEGIGVLKMTGKIAVSQVMTGLDAGKNYVSYVAVDNRSNAKASMTITDDTGKVVATNYTTRSIAKNYVSSYYLHNNHGVEPGGSYFQNMFVYFTAEAGKTYTMTLSREAGAGSVYFDDLRTVEYGFNYSGFGKGQTAQNVKGTAAIPVKYDENGAITELRQDFENVPQGIWPFVVGPVEGVNDNRTHVSELNTPYTQAGWDVKKLDDVIDGNWSIKSNGLSGRGNLVYQTIPQNFRFEPNSVYTVSFDYELGTTNSYIAVVGDGAYTNLDNLTAVYNLTRTLETTVPATPDKTGTTVKGDVNKANVGHIEFTVVGSKSGQTWIGIYSKENADNQGTSGSAAAFGGYTDFVLDNLTIKLAPPAKNELALLLQDADAMEEAVYVSNVEGTSDDDAWTALEDARDGGHTVFDDDNATQEQVEAAVTALDTAIKNLVKVEISITGTVTLKNSQGKAVEGVVLTLEDENYMPTGLTITTGADGTFKFVSKSGVELVPATYHIKAQCTGYNVITTDDIVVTKTDAKKTADISLEAEAPGAYVNDFNNGDISMMGHLLTDEEAAAKPNELPGMEWIEYNGSGALKVTWHATSGEVRHTNNVVDKTIAFANGSASYDVTALTTGVRFNVTLRASAADKRVAIGQQDEPEKWMGEFWNTDGSGFSGTTTNTIYVAPGATRNVRVVADETVFTVYIDGIQVYTVNISSGFGNPYGAMGTPVTDPGYIGINARFQNGAEFILDNIRITTDETAKNTQNVGGNVTTSGGDAISGAAIDLVNSKGERVGGTATNALGQYQINGVANGNYTLKVSAPFFVSKEQTIAVPGSNLTSKNFTLTLDKSSLTGLIDEVDKLAQSDYTDETWTPLATALATAKTVVSDNSATVAALNTAYRDLSNAKDALEASEAAAADFSTLRTLHKEMANKSNDNYTTASWEAFQKALEAARQVLLAGTATQEKVDETKTALEAAGTEGEGGLVRATPVDELDFTALEAAYEAAKDVEKGSAADAKWETFVAARDKALAIISNSDGLTQAEIDEATKALTDAQSALTKTSTRPTSTTKTETREDGTKVTTVTSPDGTVTSTVTAPEGTVSTTVTAPDGTASITVTDPDGEELVKAEIPATITVPTTRFEDVSKGHWADEAIHKLAAIDVVNGVGGNKYSPTAAMTRGQLATVLHRFSNGKTDYKTAFKDVDSNKYYAEGVAWAAKANVVKGISEDRYAPDRVITREQLATMLCRYAKLIGMSTKADTKSLDAFVDGEKTGSWAVDSMAWCVENGILKGKGNNVLDPNSDVTRAEVAVMLDRFIALIQK